MADDEETATEEVPERRRGKSNRRKKKRDRRKVLGPREEVISSQLDESVHAEALILFRNSADTIGIAKQLQWKTVGSTLIMFLALLAVGKFVSSNAEFITILKVTVIFLGTAAFLILGIYQFWQHTEGKKIASVERDFSSLWREVRAVKSSSEANIHRYLLLFIMYAAVTTGGGVTIAGLTRIAGFR